MLRKTLTILSLIGLLLSVVAWGANDFTIECTRRGGIQASWVPMIDGQLALRRVYHFSPFGGTRLEVPLWMPTLLCAVLPLH